MPRVRLEVKEVHIVEVSLRVAVALPPPYVHLVIVHNRTVGVAAHRGRGGGGGARVSDCPLGRNGLRRGGGGGGMTSGPITGSQGGGEPGEESTKQYRLSGPGPVVLQHHPASAVLGEHQHLLGPDVAVLVLPSKHV